MVVKRFRKEMGQVERVNGGTELSDAFNEYMQEALKITMEIQILIIILILIQRIYQNI